MKYWYESAGGSIGHVSLARGPKLIETWNLFELCDVDDRGAGGSYRTSMRTVFYTRLIFLFLFFFVTGINKLLIRALIYKLRKWRKSGGFKVRKGCLSLNYRIRLEKSMLENIFKTML